MKILTPYEQKVLIALIAEPTYPSRLAKIVNTNVSWMVRVIKSMRDKELVTYHKEDGKRKGLVQLTTRGEIVAKSLLLYNVDEHGEFLEHIKALLRGELYYDERRQDF